MCDIARSSQVRFATAAAVWRLTFVRGQWITCCTSLVIVAVRGTAPDLISRAIQLVAIPLTASAVPVGLQSKFASQSTKVFVLPQAAEFFEVK